MFARLAVAVKMRMLLSQRSFLALAVIALTLACCINNVKAQQPAAKPAPAAVVGSGKPAAAATGRSPKVIIVGAGLAGIAAARDLVDAGVKNVLVLEARYRPGGRLHSVKTKAGGTGTAGAAKAAAGHPDSSSFKPERLLACISVPNTLQPHAEPQPARTVHRHLQLDHTGPWWDHDWTIQQKLLLQQQPVTVGCTWF